MTRWYTDRLAQRLERELVELTEERLNTDAHDCPEKWATLSLRLGEVYSKRRRGEKSANLWSAVRCFEEAFSVLDRNRGSQEWIQCCLELGNAYARLADGQDRRFKRISNVHYKLALAAISKETSPLLWHRIHLDQALLFRKYSRSPEDEDARLSAEHYNLALGLDRDAWPEAYDLLVKSFGLGVRLIELQAELRAAQAQELPPSPAANPRD
jgi:hypothetical protein